MTFLIRMCKLCFWYGEDVRLKSEFVGGNPSCLLELPVSDKCHKERSRIVTRKQDKWHLWVPSALHIDWAPALVRGDITHVISFCFFPPFSHSFLPLHFSSLPCSLFFLFVFFSSVAIYCLHPSGSQENPSRHLGYSKVMCWTGQVTVWLNGKLDLTGVGHELPLVPSAQ